MMGQAESPAARAKQAADPVGRLEALEQAATAAGTAAIAHEAKELRDRIAGGRFFVACVGQFKRGKSTLLNALVGRQVLPTGVVPVTAVLTVLRHGPSDNARVRFLDGREIAIDPAAIAEYVTETRNPGNDKRVAAVDVEVPSDLLATGMCLVDTPGLGSVFAANTATTQAFVPHIDAALVVLGSDPPISGEELALVETIGKQVSEIMLVLNKSDRVADADSQEAARFTADTIARRLDRAAGRIFRVSAIERLAGRVTRDWTSLEAELSELAGRSGAVLEAAAERGVARIRREMLREIAEQRDALLRPIGESERRLEALRRAIAEAQLASRELSARLQVERVRLSERFEEVRQVFLQRVIPKARQDLADTIRALSPRRGPSTRAAATHAARDIAEGRVVAWSDEAGPQAERLYAATMTRFVDMANDFIRRISPDVPSGLAIDVEDISGEQRFEEPARFFFTSLLTLTDPGVWRWVLDWVRPHPSRVRSSMHHALKYLDRLMASNSTRVANDLSSRVLESQRRLEFEIRERLSALLDSAERALERARTQQAAGAEAVRTELARLDDLRDRLEQRVTLTAVRLSETVADGRLSEGGA